MQIYWLRDGGFMQIQWLGAGRSECRFIGWWGSECRFSGWGEGEWEGAVNADLVAGGREE